VSAANRVKVTPTAEAEAEAEADTTATHITDAVAVAVTNKVAVAAAVANDRLIGCTTAKLEIAVANATYRTTKVEFAREAEAASAGNR
jgi:hypothetical protein